MGKSIFTFEIKGLKALIERLDSPAHRQALLDIPKSKAIAAMIGQAIDDNFEQQGPGWAPLHPQTIRSSVSKKLKKRLQGLSNANLKEHEEYYRRNPEQGEQFRMILQKSGTLKKSVTTPGARGNIWKTVGTKIIWGTDLVYAAIHNQGGVIQHPGSKDAFGKKGLNTKPHQIKIPQREFLKLRPEWKLQIQELALNLALKTLRAITKGKP